ncbi:minor tail protein [Gordonia phage Eyre]|uniref:Minor tail protein n=1 Tax=Gordonia phage Eyre TaxID=1887646 RepID=A0A1B3B012_9CAUD|nr:minor tail protein [Gordonia phage Eyre]AOE44306.1 minor tail protein [Gordonia phage Eyre]
MPTITYTLDDGFGTVGERIELKWQPATTMQSASGALVVRGKPKPVFSTVGTPTTIEGIAAGMWAISDVGAAANYRIVYIDVPAEGGDVTGRIVAAMAMPESAPVADLIVAATAAAQVALDELDVLTKDAADADYVRSEDATTFARVGQGSIGKVAALQSRVITNYGASHGWTTFSAGGATVTLNDTTDHAFGDQCVRVVTGGAGGTTILTSPSVAAIDRATQMVRVWVKFAEADKIARLRILLSPDTGFTNYWTFESVISSSGIPEVQRPFKHGEWVPIALPWSTAVATGTPGTTNLNYVRVLINDRSAGASTIRVGRVEYMPAPNAVYPNGVCVLTYDDTFLSHYTVARTHCDRYGFRGVLFPIIERIGQPGYMTDAQFDEMAFTNGWEVGAHASTYAKHVQSVTGMTSAERAAEFAAIKAWQQQRGYVSNAFAYPNGTVDAVSELDLRKYFSLGRLALGRFSGGGADDQQVPSLPFRMYGQSCGNLTVAQVTAEIDRAIANKTMLTLLFHDLVETKVTANDTTIANHSAIIDYLATSGIAVRTYEQLRDGGLRLA